MEYECGDYCPALLLIVFLEISAVVTSLKSSRSIMESQGFLKINRLQARLFSACSVRSYRLPVDRMNTICFYD